MTKKKRTRPSEDLTLALDPALRIEGAAAARVRLLEALEGADRVGLDLTGVEEADLTALQLLCAAHRLAASRGKELCLQGSSLALGRVAEAAGFARHQGCRPGCLWIAKE